MISFESLMVLILDLASANWQFGHVRRQPFCDRGRDDRPLDDRAAVVGWLPARVPGDVRADLVAAGRIPSLDTADGIARSGWVDDVDWWFRTSLDAIDADLTGVLEASGIDYQSAIWIDDRLVATHAGMFARQSVVLSPHLNAPGRHELAIRVWGGGALPRLPDPWHRRAVRRVIGRLGLATEYFPDRMATPKAQFSFGWDFSPRVLSTGIWDDIRLVGCRGAHLEDVSVTAEPLTERDDPTPARWRVRVRGRRFRDAALRIEVAICDADGGVVGRTASSVTAAAAGALDRTLTVDVPAARRWWPWDQGEAYLYTVQVRVTDEQGLADERAITSGVRTVARGRFENGQPWRFLLNGRPVFLRGANWVPADILPGRVSGEDYRRLVGMARDAGINFLRTWGGGLREKRGFWEECNRLGIMAMQEFPLACAFLDHYGRDARYLNLLEGEARGIVTALRNHPSLIAWCGGNEISPRREWAALRTIHRIVVEEDGTRPWIPASPSEGDVHQWDVWHGAQPWQALGRVRAPFMSEFGLQALPHAGTVATFFAEGAPRSLDDAAWAERKLQAGKLRHYAGPLDEGDLAGVIAATQRAQAAGLQRGIEACRLRREGSGRADPCGGVSFWQFNEPWPAVTWAVVDGLGRPKAAYEMLKRAYQPVLIAVRFEWRNWRPGDVLDAEVWCVNDGPERLTGCSAEAVLDGVSLWQGENLTVEPGSARRAGVVAYRLSRRPVELELELRQEGIAIATNRYDLSVYLPPRQPAREWLMRRAADLLLRIG